MGHCWSWTLAESSSLSRLVEDQITCTCIICYRGDYGCSTAASLPANTISWLQSVLNAVACLVFSGKHPWCFFSRKHHQVSSLLQLLHWLKLEQRLEYKLALLAYRCLHGLAPPYLTNELQPLSTLDTRRRLRSATTNALVVLWTHLSTIKRVKG